MTTPDLDAVVLPPLGPHDHPDHHAMTWTRIEIAAIQAYATAAILADRERRAAPSDGAMRFAGWFRELPSAMNYRLWEQGGPEQSADGRDVALYERREP